MPQTEVERTVFAALILAGEPVNNLKLAALMGVSPGGRAARRGDPKSPQGSRDLDQPALELSPVSNGGASLRGANRLSSVARQTQIRHRLSSCSMTLPVSNWPLRSDPSGFFLAAVPA
jgi:hypothetical protein